MVFSLCFPYELLIEFSFMNYIENFEISHDFNAYIL